MRRMKFISFITTVAMLMSLCGFVRADGGNVSIDAMTYDGGVTMTVTSDTAMEGLSAYAAVYNSDETLKTVKVLTGVSLSAGTETITVTEDDIVFDPETETLKSFIWDDMTPVCGTYTYTEAATPDTTTNPETTDDPETTDGYVVTFETDGHATINIYYTQDYSAADETGVTTAYARNSDTGEIDTTGDGQINFEVAPDDGYEVSDVTPEGSYKNFKDLGDSLYRITKIEGAVTVTVTTTATSTGTTEPEETTGYTGTFVTDEHASVTVSTTQSFSDESALTYNAETAYARSSSTGDIDTSGSGQINFRVELDDGYSVSGITIEPSNYKNLKYPAETGTENVYRITQITSDITITITTAETVELPELDDGVISAFRYSNELIITGENTEGDVSAAITASIDGTTATELEFNSADYTDTELEITPRLTPVLAASTSAPWGDSPYVQVALSTAGYEDIYVSAKVGATKKGPASYKLQYSTDGETFTDVGESYTLSDNKTLYEAFSKVALGTDADECETLYIRIIPAGTLNINGDAFSGITGGEFGVNDILIYGTATSGSGTETTTVPLATAEATAAPSATTAATTAPSATTAATTAPSATTAATTEPEETEGYVVTFETDGHATINVYYTQDYTAADETGVTTAYARDGSTGAILTDGEGQVNFTVVPEDGYEVSSVTADANYKNLKGASDTGVANTYRLTKIIGAVTVTVTTAESSSSGDTEVAGSGTIYLNTTSIDVSDATGATADGTTLTLSVSGNYTIEGDLEDGQIVVTATDGGDVNITLNDVSVISSTAGVQPFCASASTSAINLTPTGTCSFTAAGDSTAAIITKKDLTIKCDATTDTLNVTSSSGKGIHCKGDLEIGKGNIVVNSGDDGIQGNDSVKVTAKNTSINVTSCGDGIRSNSDPSLSTEDYVSGGTVTINGGMITINAQDDTSGTNDGIQADTLLTINGGTLDITATGEALKANASSIEYLEDSTASATHPDGDGCIEIDGGTITASAGEDGIKAVKNVTINDGSITITKALDGIQVNEIIYDTDGESVLYYVAGEIDINGGTVNITSTEDGIQCKTGNINITDGDITVDATLDGIQSSYALNISGGTFDVTTKGGAVDPSNVDSSDTESRKGLKASGNIVITAGDITVDSYDDSIHSNSSVYIGDASDSTAAPTINVTSSDDGVHADEYLLIYNGDITVENSYEGLEGSAIYIYDGTMNIKATDDGINGAGDYDLDVISTASVELMADMGGNQGGNQGGSTDPGSSGSQSGPGQDGSQGGGDQGGDDSSSYGYVQIDGGYIYMTITSTGDGLDSNGSLYINGGVVIVDGCNASDADGIDFGDDNGGELDITGGYVITAAAEGMAEISTLSQTAAKIGYGTSTTSSGFNAGGAPGGNNTGGSSAGGTTLTAGSYAIVDSNDNVICAFSYTKSNIGQLIISTPNMSSSETYYIKSLTTGSAAAANMLYGTVDSSTYTFTLDSSCSVSSSGSGTTMTTISGS